MYKEIEVAPPHSLILIMDPISGVIPETMDSKLAVATESCVAIGTRAQPDGPTHIALTDEPFQTTGLLLVFEGQLTAPSKRLAVCTTTSKILVEADVAGSRYHIKIWTNDEMEPDVIRILLETTSA
jgi:hypothetical protein